MFSYSISIQSSLWKKVMVSGKVFDVEFWSWYNLALIWNQILWYFPHLVQASKTAGFTCWFYFSFKLFLFNFPKVCLLYFSCITVFLPSHFVLLYFCFSLQSLFRAYMCGPNVYFAPKYPLLEWRLNDPKMLKP